MLASQNNPEFIAPCGQELTPQDPNLKGLTSYLDALMAKCLACKSLPCLKVDAHIQDLGDGEVGELSVECFGMPIQIEQTIDLEP